MLDIVYLAMSHCAIYNNTSIVAPSFSMFFDNDELDN